MHDKKTIPSVAMAAHTTPAADDTVGELVLPSANPDEWTFVEEVLRDALLKEEGNAVSTL